MLHNLKFLPFDDWWDKAASTVGAWTIWKLRNDCVFNGAAPSIPVALAQAREEAHLWSLAGAKGLPLDTASAVVS